MDPIHFIGSLLSLQRISSVVTQLTFSQLPLLFFLTMSIPLSLLDFHITRLLTLYCLTSQPRSCESLRLNITSCGLTQSRMLFPIPSNMIAQETASYHQLGQIRSCQ